MTGFGNARRENARLSVAVEVRSVNNRYLKITTKCPDRYATFESRLEKVVRERIGRGTISISVRANRLNGDSDHRLNPEALADYWRQLQAVEAEFKTAQPTGLASLLTLPGVVEEAEDQTTDGEADWELIQGALEEAVDKLQEFRVTEGRQMDGDLRVQCAVIEEQLAMIVETAVSAVVSYRDRLLERVKELLAGTDAPLTETDLIREVSIYADRCDINEEVTRLRSHLDQFRAFLDDAASLGRKLEFLGQEIFREVNTIGSKSNNVRIAHCVVEMKAAVEKIREILQNVE